MSEAIITKKAAITDEVSERFIAAASIVVVDYRELTADEVTRLRKQLRDANVEIEIIKNSILSRAAKRAGLEGIDEVFTGPIVIASDNGGAAAPAEIMGELVEEVKVLEVKGGIIEGKISLLEEITALTKSPNREGLPSMLLSVLRAPVHSVAYTVKIVADKGDGDIAQLLHKVLDKEEQLSGGNYSGIEH